MCWLFALVACTTADEVAEGPPAADPLPEILPLPLPDEAQPLGTIAGPPPEVSEGSDPRWRITLPEDADATYSAPGWTGIVVAPVGDLDADGGGEIGVYGRIVAPSAVLDGPQMGLDVIAYAPSAPDRIEVHRTWSGPESLRNGVAAADLDGDAVSDVLFVGGTFRIEPTAPSGDIGDLVAEAFAGQAPALGDHDGDGDPDLVTVQPVQYPHDPKATVRAWLGPVSHTRAADLALTLPTFLGAPTVADLDGDGREEIVVGAPSAQVGAREEGAAYVLDPEDFAGGAPGVVLRGGFEGANAGAGGLAAPGDTDGDGYGDLVVGRYSGPCGFTEGAAPDPTAAWLVNGPIESDVVLHEAPTRWEYGGRAGHPEQGCAGAPRAPGDLDGDGRGDLTLWVEEGGLRVYTSAPSGVFDVESGADGLIVASRRHTCCEIAAADVDGDGIQDLVVGDPGDAHSDGHVYFVLAPW
jgi:hypothetical protein